MDGMIGNVGRISPASFCKAFPFHVIIGQDLRILQAGDSITRVVRELEDQSFTFTELFEVVSPPFKVTFTTLKERQDVVVVVRVRDRFSSRQRASISNDQAPRPRLSDSTNDTSHTERLNRKCLHLRGQMTYVNESNTILYMCSPSLAPGCMEDLSHVGLYLSDLPLHDATRDLLVLSGKMKAEYELIQKLEETREHLEKTSCELHSEKQITDKLLYSVLPPCVARELRQGRPVMPVKYRDASILFCGICQFDKLCADNTAMSIVHLLNQLYVHFDELAIRSSATVYKVETVGDKYMLASGLPYRNRYHAHHLTKVAIEMMDIPAAVAKAAGNGVQVRIGMHSGEIVAGVIGQTLPHYGVFGSTVCIASRMETSGLHGCINISEDTYRLLIRHDEEEPQCIYTIEPRGEVVVKGLKSPMSCYLVRGKPALDQVSTEVQGEKKQRATPSKTSRVIQCSKGTPTVTVIHEDSPD